VARRLQLPLEPAQTRSSARVDGLVRLVWAATDQLDQPLTQAVLHDWHRGLFAEGSEGLRAVAIGELRGPLPMQLVSGAIGCERLHSEAPHPLGWRLSWPAPSRIGLWRSSSPRRARC
jgi:hypothetical protein